MTSINYWNAHQNKRFKALVDDVIKPRNVTEKIICSFLLTTQDPRATVSMLIAYKESLNANRYYKIKSEISGLAIYGQKKVMEK